MAAKKQTKSKTRTATKKQGFQFKWWMGLGLVVVVALVGVLVFRFSRACAAPFICGPGTDFSGKYLGYSGGYDHYAFGFLPDVKMKKWVDSGDGPVFNAPDYGKCYIIQPVTKGSTNVHIWEVGCAYFTG
jgi:hypothetical protein